tara:strand:- start:467 stop:904 length:438 start_codon:yes stop_codon:yes gene_type:complete
MNNWLEDFKKKTQLEHQTLYRFYTREYESLDEVLFDLNDYLEIAYGGNRFEEQKELFINSHYKENNLSNLKDQYKEHIIDFFLNSCKEINLKKLINNEDYLRDNDLLNEQGKDSNLDRHTIVMANIVDFMILAIENWYDERTKDE